MLLCIVLLLSTIPLSVSGYTQPADVFSPTWTAELTDWVIAPETALRTAGARSLALAGTDPTAASFDTSDWAPAKVPGSVFGNLVDDGVFDDTFAANNDGKKDPYFAANSQLVDRRDFDTQWWYSIDIDVPAEQAAKYFMLNIKQISYTGEVYVNGTRVFNTNLNITQEDELRNKTGTGASTGKGSNPSAPFTYTDPASTNCPSTSSVYNDTVWANYKGLMKGAYRTYDLDLTGLIHAGKNNIKIRVKKMYNRIDFGPFFHDWHPAAPDNDMGLNGKAVLVATGPVHIDNPFVITKVAADLSYADLSFYCEATNMSDQDVTGTITGVVKDPDGKIVNSIVINKSVTIPAKAYCREVQALLNYRLFDAKLWWPYLSGDQPLYTVDYVFTANGAVSDTLHHRFGIREVKQEVNKFANHAQAYTTQVYVNHQPIVIKGGGFSALDHYYRHSQISNISFMEVMKEMGLNLFRDEGKFYSEDIYDLADEYGFLMMCGVMCCDRNETGPSGFSKAERFLQYEMYYSLIRTIRSHPCALWWLNGSDNAKDDGGSGAALENKVNLHRKMLEIEGRLRWYDVGLISPNVSGYISDNGGRNSNLIGVPPGTEMDHGYDTATPAKSFTSVGYTAGDTEYAGGGRRGIWGFVSEGSGGMGIPVYETLYKIIPKDSMWPYNQGHTGTGASGPGPYNYWSFYACRSSFNRIDLGVMFVDGTYGGSDTLQEFEKRAQAFQYDYQRAIYEALNMRRYVRATGFINWMLNSPRPGTMWNQFDYYFNPHGGTYGVAKANEPLHIMYDPFEKEAKVINSTRTNYGNMTASLKIYDIDGNLINDPLVKTINVIPDGVTSWSGGTEMILNAFVPTVRDGDDWFRNDYTKYEILYGAQTTSGRRAQGSTGVISLWKSAEVEGSLVRPTTDVYFVSLELADAVGNVASRNDYALSRRMDVVNGSDSWSTAQWAQVMDMTQLNQLKPAQLSVVNNVGGYSDNGLCWVQTVEITNNSKNVAYGVELKSYMDGNTKDMLAATYDDNFITLFPGESRTITAKHQTAYKDGPAVITVNSYNSVIENNKPGHSGNVYLPADPGKPGGPPPLSATSTTTNLARNVNSGTTYNATSASAATQVNHAQSITNANTKSYTVLDNYLWANLALTSGQQCFVNLGSSKTFDRINVRWNSNNSLPGAPDYVTIDISPDGVTDWTTVVDNFDNTKSKGVLTAFTLDKAYTAQYIRITPNGFTKASAAFGAAAGGSGETINDSVGARNAPTSFNCNSVEVYRSYNNVFVEFAGNGGSVDANGTVLTPASNGMERTVKAYAGENLVLNCTSDNPGGDIVVIRDGKMVEAATGALSVSIADINEYTEVKIVFGDFPQVSFDPGTGTASVIIKDKDAVLIAAAKNANTNRLVVLKTAVDPVATAPIWRTITLTDPAFADLTGKYLEVYVWNKETYVPLIDKHTF